MRSGNITMKRATAKINRFPKPSVAKAKERAPLAEQAYREIKRRILDNEFSPGTTIVEQELAALESESAGLIAESGLASEHIDALKQSVTDMDHALAADDLVSWAAADERFHGRLIDNCPNSRLRHIVYQFWDQAHRVRMMTLRLRPKPVTSNRDHRSLIKAIERREPDRAREVLRRHLLRSGKMLVELLQTHGFKAL